MPIFITDAALELVAGAAAAKDVELAYVLQMTPAPPPELLYADSGRLIQILTNLIYNSIKFTDKVMLFHHCIHK